VKAQIQDMKDKIREPKRELVQLPYVMPSAECEDEAYRDIGGPKVRVLCTVAEKLPLGFAPSPPIFLHVIAARVMDARVVLCAHPMACGWPCRLAGRHTVSSCSLCSSNV
jgi:hypothetical protein